MLIYCLLTTRTKHQLFADHHFVKHFRSIRYDIIIQLGLLRNRRNNADLENYLKPNIAFLTTIQ